MDRKGTSDATQGDSHEAIAWVDQWQPSSPLTALQELLALAPRVRQAVADRLQLHVGDLLAIEHLVAEPIGPVELSRRIGLTSAAATVAVDRLQERGHVVREADPKDGRRTRVVVTESGRADVFAELLPMFQALASASQDLSERDSEVVEAFLNRAADAMRSLL
ncbi:MAG: MarR family transcriptional regulator [Actinomycetota bacterium]|nr:MarR family transcriptional regulator [Actinomycetota bacterium]MDP2288208.1 MarR family transcriptional regulator [Actinomycetota bacterium]